jgi:NAD(P)H-dependent FMN reductase
MKNILIVSATLKSNYKLAKQLKKLIDKEANATVISLENYDLPVYTEKAFDKYIKSNQNTIKKLTKHFIDNQGIIICAPEYNGSTPPIVNNAIAWISTTTKYWRDAFNNKIALIATNSGGPGTKYITIMKLQMEHLGCIVMPRSISANESNPLNIESTKKILEKFINLA